jgi:hypothetical protein
VELRTYWLKGKSEPAAAGAERRIRPLTTTNGIGAAVKRAADSNTVEVLKDPDQAGLELRTGGTGEARLVSSSA